MANVVNQFIDPDDTYTGGYTSEVIASTDYKKSSAVTRGVIQLDITSGTVDLEMRLSPDAPWEVVRTYDSSILEEIVIANFNRVVVSDAARVWLGETL